MELDPSVVENLNPWHYDVFYCDNPVQHSRILHTRRIRLAVMDSSIVTHPNDTPLVAAIIIPKDRETDWSFDTEAGHRQLLNKYYNVTRLILIGNDPRSIRPPKEYVLDLDLDVNTVEEETALKNTVMLLYPNVEYAFKEVRFLQYKDDLKSRVVVFKGTGPIVGDFVIEDVLLEGHQEIVRRLRYKRNPNWNQAVLKLGDTMEVNSKLLIHEPWIAMVSSLSLISNHLYSRIYTEGVSPTVFCIGGGGGSFASILNCILVMDVVNVDEDLDMLVTSKCLLAETSNYSVVVPNIQGETSGCSVKLFPHKPIDTILELSEPETHPHLSYLHTVGCSKKFDIIMVDVNTIEDRCKYGICSPPRTMVTDTMLNAMKSLINDQGILIINVVSPDYLFYFDLEQKLKSISYKVYRVDFVSQQQCILSATFSPPVHVDDNIMDHILSLHAAKYVKSILEV